MQRNEIKDHMMVDEQGKLDRKQIKKLRKYYITQQFILITHLET